jgi:hypothetical protein
VGPRNLHGYPVVVPELGVEEDVVLELQLRLVVVGLAPGPAQPQDLPGEVGGPGGDLGQQLLVRSPVGLPVRLDLGPALAGLPLERGLRLLPEKDLLADVRSTGRDPAYYVDERLVPLSLGLIKRPALVRPGGGVKYPVLPL